MNCSSRMSWGGFEIYSILEVNLYYKGKDTHLRKIVKTKKLTNTYVHILHKQNMQVFDFQHVTKAICVFNRNLIQNWLGWLMIQHDTEKGMITFIEYVFGQSEVELF